MPNSSILTYRSFEDTSEKEGENDIYIQSCANSKYSSPPVERSFEHPGRGRGGVGDAVRPAERVYAVT